MCQANKAKWFDSEIWPSASQVIELWKPPKPATTLIGPINLNKKYPFDIFNEKVAAFPLVDNPRGLFMNYPGTMQFVDSISISKNTGKLDVSITLHLSQMLIILVHFIYFLRLKNLGTLYHNQQWFRHSGVACRWRQDVLCQPRAYAESALPGPMAGRPRAMAELTRRALCWHGTSRRHLQETDEPNQTFLLFWNGGSIF